MLAFMRGSVISKHKQQHMGNCRHEHKHAHIAQRNILCLLRQTRLSCTHIHSEANSLWQCPTSSVNKKKEVLAQAQGPLAQKCTYTWV